MSIWRKIAHTNIIELDIKDCVGISAEKIPSVSEPYGYLNA